MTRFTPLETVGSFHVPDFELRLEGGADGARLRHDAIDLTYSDDVDALDSFEVSLVDWDPVRLEPVYSSPWDSAGAVRSYPTARGQAPIPVLAPGTPMTLYLTYRDHGTDPVLMLRGKVVSLTTAFPAAGTPTARVRVLNPLADYEAVTLTGNATGGALDVIAEIAGQLGLDLDTGAVPAEIRAAEAGQAGPVHALSELNAVEHLRRLARGLGLSARLAQGEGGDRLVLAAGEDVAHRLVWGRTLMSFTPKVSTRSLVGRVVVRGQNPAGRSESEQRVEAVATWSDLPDLDTTALGPGALEDIIAGLEGTEEVIDKPSRAQNEAPDRAALNRLRELAADLVTCSGQTLGLPTLRAGSRVEIGGVGARFSGIYEVTKTTHAFTAAGYLTTFEGRKEIFG